MVDTRDADAIDRDAARSTPLVGAVVLNWNRSDDTIRAVRSLLAHERVRVYVVVVDNGSNPTDLENLRAALPNVAVVANGANHGFARAVNIGAARALEAGAHHILLFNNDAFFDPQIPALERCVEALEADGTLGAVGPVIVNDDAQRTVQSAGMFFSLWFPVPIGNGRGRPIATLTKVRPASYLMGSCLLVRGEAFARIGGLDSDYFFFGEDIHVGYALRRHGYRERVLLDTSIVHNKSSSVREGSERYAYTALRANLLVLRKNASWYHLPTAALTMLAISLALCVRSSTSWRGAGPKPVLRAWSDFFRGRLGGLDGTWPAGFEPIDFSRLWRATSDRRLAR